MLNHHMVVHLYGLDDVIPAVACLPTCYITPSLTRLLARCVFRLLASA